MHAKWKAAEDGLDDAEADWEARMVACEAAFAQYERVNLAVQAEMIRMGTKPAWFDRVIKKRIG